MGFERYEKSSLEYEAEEVGKRAIPSRSCDAAGRAMKITAKAVRREAAFARIFLIKPDCDECDVVFNCVAARVDSFNENMNFFLDVQVDIFFD